MNAIALKGTPWTFNRRAAVNTRANVGSPLFVTRQRSWISRSPSLLSKTKN